MGSDGGYFSIGEKLQEDDININKIDIPKG